MSQKAVMKTNEAKMRSSNLQDKEQKFLQEVRLTSSNRDLSMNVGLDTLTASHHILEDERVFFDLISEIAG